MKDISVNDAVDLLNSKQMAPSEMAAQMGVSYGLLVKRLKTAGFAYNQSTKIYEGEADSDLTLTKLLEKRNKSKNDVIPKSEDKQNDVATKSEFKHTEEDLFSEIPMKEVIPVSDYDHPIKRMESEPMKNEVGTKYEFSQNEIIQLKRLVESRDIGVLYMEMADLEREKREKGREKAKKTVIVDEGIWGEFEEWSETFPFSKMLLVEHAIKKLMNTYPYPK